jgi:cyclophilin family peptidyl-prolyl cis-trans isomerase
MTIRLAIVTTLGLALAMPGMSAQRPAAPAAAGANPVVVLETAKGTIEIELFRADAPKSIAHLVGLIQKGFYRGLRFHRVTDSLVQIGDPQTRNMSLEGMWGQQSSGSPIGVSEISKTRKHVRGSVGLAYSGAPENADSQFYIMKTASPSLDGKYAVVGQVLKGMDVVDKIQKADALGLVSLKAAGPK